MYKQRSRGFVTAVFVAVLLSVMQESVDELGSENIQGVTPILKLCPASGPSIAIVFSSDLWELHEQTLEQGGGAKFTPFLALLYNKSPFDLFFPSLLLMHFFMSSELASARRMGSMSWLVAQPWPGPPAVDGASSRVPRAAPPCVWLLPTRCFKINSFKG